MEIVCLDTDILIEHKRAKEKSKTKFFLYSAQYEFAVTVITVYELLRGDNSVEDKFWQNFFSQVSVLDMNIYCAELAGTIYRNLKQTGNMINIEDILIASIAIKHELRLATNNTNCKYKIAQSYFIFIQWLMPIDNIFSTNKRSTVWTKIYC